MNLSFTWHSQAALTFPQEEIRVGLYLHVGADINLAFGLFTFDDTSHRLDTTRPFVLLRL